MLDDSLNPSCLTKASKGSVARSKLVRPLSNFGRHCPSRLQAKGMLSQCKLSSSDKASKISGSGVQLCPAFSGSSHSSAELGVGVAAIEALDEALRFAFEGLTNLLKRCAKPLVDVVNATSRTVTVVRQLVGRTEMESCSIWASSLEVRPRNPARMENETVLSPFLGVNVVLAEKRL